MQRWLHRREPSLIRPCILQLQFAARPMRMVRHHRQSQLLRQQKTKQQGLPLLAATQHEQGGRQYRRPSGQLYRRQSGGRYRRRYGPDGSAIRMCNFISQYVPQQQLQS